MGLAKLWADVINSILIVLWNICVKSKIKHFKYPVFAYIQTDELRFKTTLTDMEI